MNPYRHKLFRRILNRNLICMTIPYALILLAVFFLMFQISGMEDYSVYKTESYKEALEEYAAGRMNFEFPVSDIYYTGFDYTEGNQIKGRYFYTLGDTNMQLFLLDKKTSEQILKDGNKTITLKCKITQDELTTGYIEEEYADGLGIDYSDINGYISPFLFSAVAYPAIMIPLVRLLLLISAALFAILLIYTIAALFLPVMNPEMFKFRKYGKLASLVKELDQEMEERMLYRQSPYIVTENYLVIALISRIDIIPLWDVRMLTKHTEKKRRFPGGERISYRLTVTNHDETFFECDFSEEEVIDDVIDYIRFRDEHAEKENEPEEE